MAKLTTAEFIDAIKELSVLELNDLVKACEEEFGVSAAAGVELTTVMDCYILFIQKEERYEVDHQPLLHAAHL